jgi:hypothetical protein
MIAPAALSRSTDGASSVGHVVAIDRAAERGADVLGDDQILHRERHAVEGPSFALRCVSARSAALALWRARSASSVT